MLPMQVGSRLFSFNRIAILAIFLLLVLVTSVLAEGPVEVNVGLKVSQITGIDQKAENFGAVVTMIMEWNEPALAVPPGKQAPQETMYEAANFIRLMSERELLWPAISF